MKKIISILLCFAMLFSLSSFAFAAEEYTTVKAYAIGGNEDLQEYKTSIETLTFTKTPVGANAVNGGDAWDISAAGNKSVFAWLEDSDADGLYEAFISANGANIYANENSSYMFEGYTALKKIEGMNLFKTDNVLYMESMFANCTSLGILDVQYFETAKVQTMKSMFENCKSLVTFIGFNQLDTSSVTLTNRMFYNCEALVSLDLSSFDTADVTDMSYMFYNCKKLSVCDFGYENITNGTDFAQNSDASKFDTDNVTDMSYMFAQCAALTDLNLSGFNTVSVKAVTKMFYGCTYLENLDLSNWNFKNLGGKNQAFYQFISKCTSLKNLYLYGISGYDADYHDFEENFEGVYGVRIYTENKYFEQYALWKNVLKYIESASVLYKDMPADKAILTFTKPNGVSYYCVSVIGSGENDFLFSDETRSYKKNTKLQISLYGSYPEYTFYVNGIAKTVAREESIYIVVVDDAAIYAVGQGISDDVVDGSDKDENKDETDNATNFLGVFSILFNRIIAFFKKLFGIA